MFLRKPTRRSARRITPLRHASQPVCEQLENRQLLAATVVAAIPPILATPSQPTNDSFDLSPFFNDPNITGSVVTFNTTAGTITVALTDNATPNTVQNFLNYVRSTEYNGTFFHRNFVFATNSGSSPSAPADIVQGGGFTLTGGLQHIATNPAIADEYTQRLFGDVAGTISTAKTSEANSTTSEFFFNVHDNSQALDTPTRDSQGNLTSYTPFGQVIGNGMSVINTLAALPTVDLSKVNGALATLPVTGIPESVIAAGKAQVGAANLEFINTAKIIPALDYTVTSDNPALVQPTVSNGRMTFTYGAGLSGVADITITANSADGISTVSQTFSVTVPNTANPAQGPTANPDTPPVIITGTTSVVHVLANDIDSVAAVNPASVTITTAPTSGSVSVDPITGYITYVPTTGFIGTDSLQYTFRDVHGFTSSPATVSFNVVPTAIKITIGTPASRDLTYTQPDGTVAHLSVSGGTAVVTFAGYRVAPSTIGGHVTASGADSTITDITITHQTQHLATLSLTSKTGVPTIGSVNDAIGGVGSINAPTAEVTGAMNLVQGLAFLSLGSTNGATITIGGGGILQAVILIGTATNTSISDISPFRLLKSKSWLNPSGTGTINCPAIDVLQVPGEFDENLTLTSTNQVGIGVANVGTLGGGTWDVTNVVLTLNAKSVASAWRLSTRNLVRTLNFGGDLSSTIITGAITNLTVGGNMKNAIIETDANFTPRFNQLNRVTVRGSISSSAIVAAGNIGSITAKGMTGSSILAGLDSTVVNDGSLPMAAADFTAKGATIQSIQFGKKGTFANSRISAGILGSLQIGTVTTSDGGTRQGIAAGIIRSLSTHLDTGSTLILGKAQLKDAAALTAYLTAAKITPFNDFNIVVIPAS